MLIKIGEQQLAAMARGKEHSFHRIILKQLRVDYPEQTFSKPDTLLLEEIQQAHLKAKSYGITRNPTLCQFIYLSIAFEPKFYEDPHVDEFLKDKPAKAEERFSILLDVAILHLTQTDS